MKTLIFNISMKEGLANTWLYRKGREVVLTGHESQDSLNSAEHLTCDRTAPELSINVFHVLYIDYLENTLSVISISPSKEILSY